MRNAFLPGLLLAALAGSPAAADWLVTLEGDRLETRGPWQVRGKLVVFTAASGTLSSLRLDEVDLEASAAATEEARKPPPAVEPAPPPRKAPVLVLTDADVPKARRPEPQQQPGEGEAEEGEAEEPAVTVTSWAEISEPDSLDVQIFGTLRNNTEEVATDLAVAVQLFGGDGALLSRQPALLNLKSLPPGATTNFRAVFPGIYSFSSVTFEVEGNRMRLQGTEPVEGSSPPDQTGGR